MNGPELGGVDRGVLDERDGLPVALGPEQEAEAGLAELPDGLLLGGVVGDVGGVADPLARAERLQRLDLGAHLRLALAGVLDDHDGRGIALDESHPRPLLDVLPREVEDHLVRHLDRVRPRGQELDRRLERRLEVVVVDHVEGRELGRRTSRIFISTTATSVPSEPTARRWSPNGCGFTNSSRL